MNKYDAIIIGGGPGGYVAAQEVTRLGGKACIIEENALGGTCLHKGCIPTKAMLASAELFSKIRGAEDFGFTVKDVSIDFSKVIKRRDSIVNRLNKGIAFLMRKEGIEVIMGKGRLKGQGTVEVTLQDGTTALLKGQSIIIATGSRPSLHPNFAWDGDIVITSQEALELTSIPDTLLIIGGGAIGCEYASLFAEFGSEVTLIEMEESILPFMEREISALLTNSMKKRNIRVQTGVKVAGVEKKESKGHVTLTSGETIIADKVLVSIGRKPNTEGLGLEELRVPIGPRGEILVDDHMFTGVDGIYAIGDVTGKILLAHVASAQAITVAENVMGLTTRMDYEAVPSCIFTLPEVASVGMTTEVATSAGYDVKVGRYSFVANGKALAMGAGEGLAKVLVDGGTGQLLGIHIIGPGATELISEATLAIQLGAGADELARTIHAHPTLAETLREAAWGVEY